MAARQTGQVGGDGAGLFASPDHDGRAGVTPSRSPRWRSRGEFEVIAAAEQAADLVVGNLGVGGGEAADRDVAAHGDAERARSATNFSNVRRSMLVITLPK